MPGRLELRREYEPYGAGYGPPRRTITREVWIEDPPLYGRSEFRSEREAREWLADVRELDLLRTRARGGDRMAHRRANALQLEMNAFLHTNVNPPQVYGSGGNTMIIDDLSDFTSPVTRSTTATERWLTDNSLVSGTYSHQHSLDAMRYAWMQHMSGTFSIPAELKKQSDDMNPTIETDPYLGTEGVHAQTYISIPDPDNEGYIRYWRTDGRISQQAVARVFSRYYASHAHVMSLRRPMASSLDKNALEGVELIHPDFLVSSKHRWRRLERYVEDEWFRDTYNLPIVHWNGSQWIRRVNKDKSINGFKVVDPHGVFQE